MLRGLDRQTLGSQAWRRPVAFSRRLMKIMSFRRLSRSTFSWAGTGPRVWKTRWPLRQRATEARNSKVKRTFMVCLSSTGTGVPKPAAGAVRRGDSKCPWLSVGQNPMLPVTSRVVGELVNVGAERFRVHHRVVIVRSNIRDRVSIFPTPARRGVQVVACPTHSVHTGKLEDVAVGRTPGVNDVVIGVRTPVLKRTRARQTLLRRIGSQVQRVPGLAVRLDKKINVTIRSGEGHIRALRIDKCGWLRSRRG